MSQEQPETPRYTKDLDVGRIVIEEIPEKKQEIPKRKLLRKEQPRPKSTEMKVTQHEIEELPQKSNYRKDLDVGRIVIDEISEEKKDLPKSHRKKKVASKSTKDTLIGDEVKEIPTAKEDTVKVGKLDVTTVRTNVGERTKTYEDHKVFI